MSLRNYDDEPTVIVERRDGAGAGMFLAGLAIGAGLGRVPRVQCGPAPADRPPDRCG